MNSRDVIRSRYDAIIVGARGAGAATAMLLARAGLRVLGVERSAHGSDTLSTHALMRAGVMQLHRWGVLDRIRAAGTLPIVSKSCLQRCSARLIWSWPCRSPALNASASSTRSPGAPDSFGSPGARAGRWSATQLALRIRSLDLDRTGLSQRGFDSG